jgi:hypothetical protein
MLYGVGGAAAGNAIGLPPVSGWDQTAYEERIASRPSGPQLGRRHALTGGELRAVGMMRGAGPAVRLSRPASWVVNSPRQSHTTRVGWLVLRC